MVRDPFAEEKRKAIEALADIPDQPPGTVEPIVVEEEGYRVLEGDEAKKKFLSLKDQYGEGLSTGFDALDYFFTFLPEQLYLISAATHVGKTMFALNMCSRIASTGKKVVYASLEQGVFIVPLVEKILAKDYPSNLAILDSDQMLGVRTIIKAVTELEVKPDLLCIDHVHFLKKKGNGATEDMDETILEVQNMAKTLQIPVIVIAHVRKINSNRPPDLDDLRDSSSLNQVPGVVLLLHRNKEEEGEDSYLSNNGSLFVAKNRIQGRTGLLNYKLQPSGDMIFDDPKEKREAKKKAMVKAAFGDDIGIVTPVKEVKDTDAVQV